MPVKTLLIGIYLIFMPVVVYAQTLDKRTPMQVLADKKAEYKSLTEQAKRWAKIGEYERAENISKFIIKKKLTTSKREELETLSQTEQYHKVAAKQKEVDDLISNNKLVDAKNKSNELLQLNKDDRKTKYNSAFIDKINSNYPSANREREKIFKDAKSKHDNGQIEVAIKILKPLLDTKDNTAINLRDKWTKEFVKPTQVPQKSPFRPTPSKPIKRPNVSPRRLPDTRKNENNKQKSSKDTTRTIAINRGGISNPEGTSYITTIEKRYSDSLKIVFEKLPCDNENFSNFEQGMSIIQNMDTVRLSDNEERMYSSLYYQFKELQNKLPKIVLMYKNRDPGQLKYVIEDLSLLVNNVKYDSIPKRCLRNLLFDILIKSYENNKGMSIVGKCNIIKRLEGIDSKRYKLEGWDVERKKICGNLDCAEKSKNFIQSYNRAITEYNNCQLEQAKATFKNAIDEGFCEDTLNKNVELTKKIEEWNTKILPNIFKDSIEIEKYNEYISKAEVAYNTGKWKDALRNYQVLDTLSIYNKNCNVKFKQTTQDKIKSINAILIELRFDSLYTLTDSLLNEYNCQDAKQVFNYLDVQKVGNYRFDAKSQLLARINNCLGIIPKLINTDTTKIQIDAFFRLQGFPYVDGTTLKPITPHLGSSIGSNIFLFPSNSSFGYHFSFEYLYYRLPIYNRIDDIFAVQFIRISPIGVTLRLGKVKRIMINGQLSVDFLSRARLILNTTNINAQESFSKEPRFAYNFGASYKLNRLMFRVGYESGIQTIFQEKNQISSVLSKSKLNWFSITMSYLFRR